MKLHRFYVHPDRLQMTHELWVHDQPLLNQWLRVLRFREGSQVVLFDGVETERLYKIVQVEKDGVKLELVTEFERKLPERHIYLFFSLLKKDKNEWVLQKCTELGVRNFVPIVADRSEKTGFNLERSEKIVIEAAEQCGRSDIPDVREPIGVNEFINDYQGKLTVLVCDEREEGKGLQPSDDPVGVLIGPEGGWTGEELARFKEVGFGSLHLGKLTLRAETAAVAAVTKLV